MFSVPFEQIGTILDRSPEAARQLASRGRRRIRGVETPVDDDPSAQEEVIEAFLGAARDGDFEALAALLDPDIVARQDWGTGTLIEIRGAEEVARRAASASQLGLVAHRALVNGGPGWISLRDGKPFAVASLTVRNGRVAAMDIIADPERLATLDLSALDI
jgi:RNA polymerase sigma-70 factor (ECF subfamily)